jgi:hypothetical protein
MCNIGYVRAAGEMRESSGNSVVRADTTTNLGVVEPGAGWVITEP